MYEFVETPTGWLICWGPPPRSARPSASRPQTLPPSREGHPDVSPSVEPVTHNKPAAPLAAGQ